MAQDLANLKVNIDATTSRSVKKAGSTLDDLHNQQQKINKTSIKPKFSRGASRQMKKLSGVFNDARESAADLARQVPIVGDRLGNMISKMTMGHLAGIGAVAGLGYLTTQFFKIGNEIDKAEKKFDDFTKGGNLEKITAKARALNQEFDTSLTKISKTQRFLQESFGMEGPKAIEKIRKALVATDGELEMQQLKENLAQAKTAGINASKAITQSVMDQQKGYQKSSVEVMKEFNVKMAELSKSQAKELERRTGMNIRSIQQQVEEGKMSMREAFQEIFGNYEELSNKKQTALKAGLIGGQGEDASAALIKNLAESNKSLEKLVKNQTEGDNHSQRMVEKQTKINNIMARITGKSQGIGDTIQEGWADFKIGALREVETVMMSINSLSDGIKEAWNGVENSLGNIEKKGNKKGGSEESMTDKGMKLPPGLGWLGLMMKKGQFTDDEVKKIFDESHKRGFMTGEGGGISAVDMTNKWEKQKDEQEETNNKLKSIQEILNNNKPKEAIEKLIKRREKEGTDEDKINKAIKKLLNKTILSTSDFSELDRDFVKTQSDHVKGATSQVKNITVNLDALQDIENQVINEGDDVDNVEAQLREALLRVVNDVNQTKVNK